MNSKWFRVKLIEYKRYTIFTYAQTVACSCLLQSHGLGYGYQNDTAILYSFIGSNAGRSRIASSRSQLALQWRPKMFIWSGFCASYPKVEEPTQKHRHILPCLAQLSLGTNHWSRRSNQCHPGLPRELSSDIRGIGCPPIFTSSLPKSLELSQSSVLKPEYLPSGPNVGTISSLWPQTPGHGGE